MPELPLRVRFVLLEVAALLAGLLGLAVRIGPVESVAKVHWLHQVFWGALALGAVWLWLWARERWRRSTEG